VPPNWAGTPDGRYLEPFETVAKAKVRAARRPTLSPPENFEKQPHAKTLHPAGQSTLAQSTRWEIHTSG
jgi:hypothetical protein